MKLCHGCRQSAFGSRLSRSAICAVAVALALTVIVDGRPLDKGSDGLSSLSSLSRLVRHFDFEEGERAPFEMPLNFYRYGADEGGIAHGFPPFGTMKLTREDAYSGNWSFMFDLDGGSMAARVPSAVIPIMPGADYTVALRVKTEGLTHARARLAAWLYDERGRIIPGSRSESRFINAEGEWQAIAVPVRGRYQQAADLGIELQLLQPDQVAKGAVDPYTPTLVDVTGRVFFDDVSVWQKPRIMMSTKRPGNVVVSPDQPQLVIEVQDVVHSDLDARLRVYDLRGELVFEERFPAPRSPRQRTIDLPLEQFGWYRASLDIVLHGELAAQRRTDLAYLPPPRRSGVGIGAGGNHRFTLSLPESWQEHDDVLPELIRRLGVSAVIMPVLTQSMTMRNAPGWYQRSRKTIEHLRGEHIDLTFSLDGVPEELASELDLNPEEVLIALEREPAIWRDYLDELIVNYSFEVPRWQIGRSGSDTVAWIDDAPQRIGRTVSGLRRLVPGGSVLIPSNAQHMPEVLSEYASYHVTVPYHVNPKNIESLAKLWLVDGDRLAAQAADVYVDDFPMNLEPAPLGLYSHEQRAADLMLRVLHAWRADVRHLSLKPPWTSLAVNGAEIMPQETLPVWNQLIDQLRGRRVVGTLALGQGIHCWLLAGVDRADAALVAWKDTGTTERGFELQLADGPVAVTDGFGNRRTVPLRRDVHTIELDEMPRFVEGINLELVQFRGGFALDPDFLPVEARMHEHEFVLQNPWPMPINGTIRLSEMEGITFSPRTHRFSIPAGGEARLPVEIQLARGILAGTKRIKADVTLAADGQYDLMLFKDVLVALEHIDFSATSRTSRNPETGDDDLIITQYITNTGQQPLNVEAFILGRGMPHERRLISGLNPGEMAIRVFTIPNGANRLASESIRVGVIERDGVARLNQVIDVPAQ